MDLLALPEAPPEYTRVKLSGKFDHGRSQYVGPRVRQVAGQAKSGYLLVTPLTNERWHRMVLVNRGWVPEEWRTQAEARRVAQPKGEVSGEDGRRGGGSVGGWVGVQPWDEEGGGWVEWVWWGWECRRLGGSPPLW